MKNFIFPTIKEESFSSTRGNMENKIFYFSTTGKSFWTALTLANELTNCDIIAIKDYDIDKPVHAKRIGFIFPVFRGGLPEIIKYFLSELKIDGTPYIFSIHTYSNNDGITSLQIREKMLSCETPINAVFPLKMKECNSHYAYSNIFDENEISKMLLRTQRKISKAAKIISSEQNYLKNDFPLFANHKRKSTTHYFRAKNKMAIC